ncbi:MAG: hypothetical protein AAF468_12725 [Pseudomonadota bacterium]
MRKLDIGAVRYDAIDGGVVFASGADEVLITLDAIETYFSKPFAPQEAINHAIEISPLLRRVANATPCRDGRINITNAILNERDWEVPDAD